MATRANVEQLLVDRCGPLMVKAGMAVTYVGSNANLNDPIGWSLRQVGYTVSSITSVSSAEVQAVSDSDLDEFLDLVELRLLESIMTNLDDVDTTVGARSEKLNQLADRVEKRLDALRKRIADAYGYGAAVLEIGQVALDFAEHDDGT